MSKVDHTIQSEIEAACKPRPRAADWLWHPWYAKAWWIAIPIYWFIAGGVIPLNFMRDFYPTTMGMLTSFFFTPLMAGLMLGHGYVRALWESSAPAPFASEDIFGPRTTAGRPTPTMDPMDPRSGPLWIGSPRHDQ